MFTRQTNGISTICSTTNAQVGVGILKARYPKADGPVSRDELLRHGPNYSVDPTSECQTDATRNGQFRINTNQPK
ncbi:hypothetical protein WG66_012970 [Moniliophthora roreri]|nr:hypothetical protein WG66_012970 [Moniliophthora roreri]